MTTIFRSFAEASALMPALGEVNELCTSESESVLEDGSVSLITAHRGLQL